MTRLRLVVFPVCLTMASAVAWAQAPAKVDFARDVAPILQGQCVSCHGPNKQNAGMRLDRRSSAMKMGSRRIVPGNAVNSMVYERVVGESFGQQMPLTGELKPEQVETIKEWIEQGAEWPDALANEVDKPGLDAKAVAMVDDLQKGHVAAFLAKAKADPALLNARGPEGSTPFMYAVLYTETPTLAKLLALGAEVNRKNDANATALMWGVHDAAKAKLLLDHGAEVNAVSDDFRSALMIAARQPDNQAVVKMLLDHGANTNPNAHPEAASSPLLEAATGDNAASFELLIEHGAKLQGDAEPALTMSIQNGCGKCVELIAARISNTGVYTGALQDTAFLGDVASIRMLLAHGARVNSFDVMGRTPLMYAATSDLQPVEAVKLLVASGADVNAADRHTKTGDAGMTALTMAERHGDTELVRFLRSSGAMETQTPKWVENYKEQNDVRSAIADSLPLLQKAAVGFSSGAGCFSCHNNSLTQMTIGMARKQGFAIDEKLANAEIQGNGGGAMGARELLHQGFLVPVEDTFSDGVMAYALIGLAAEGYKSDLGTDASVMEIRWRQNADGNFPALHADTRQPLCKDYIGETAMDMRAMQLYPVKTQIAVYNAAVIKAANWLAHAKSLDNEDRSWRVAGLAWAANQPAALKVAMRELVAAQKSDGGWSDLPTMDSTAYATGKSMVALKLGGMAVSDPVYKKGVAWLLSHQQKDGTWWVRTRALGFQPIFDPGFPHGTDQFISSAATNWADQALEFTLPEKAAVHALVEKQIGRGGSR